MEVLGTLLGTVELVYVNSTHNKNIFEKYPAKFQPLALYRSSLLFLLLSELMSLTLSVLEVQYSPLQEIG